MSPEPADSTSDERIVECGDAKIYARRYGQGNPALLLHGWTLDHRSFSPQVAALARSVRVVTLDRRGCGRSTGEPDLDAEVSDLDTVINTLCGQPAHLLGVSQGGRLALRYAALRPGKVRSLVLQGAALDGYDAGEDPDEAVPLAKYTRWAADGEMERLRADWMSHPLMSAGVDAELRSALRAMVADYTGRDLLVSSPTVTPDDIGARLATQPLPVLIITGEYEIAERRRQAEHLLELLPRARHVIVEGAGHLVNLSHPARFNNLVTGFWKEIDR